MDGDYSNDFKKGDWVALNSEKGMLVSKVVSVEGDLIYSYWDDKDYTTCVYIGNLRKATQEEIEKEKERRSGASKLQEIKELRNNQETILILIGWLDKVDWLIQTVGEQQEEFKRKDKHIDAEIKTLQIYKEMVKERLNDKDIEIERLKEFISACRWVGEGGLSKLREDANNLLKDELCSIDTTLYKNIKLEELIDKLCDRKTGLMEAYQESYDDPEQLKRYKYAIEELDSIIDIIT